MCRQFRRMTPARVPPPLEVKGGMRLCRWDRHLLSTWISADARKMSGYLARSIQRRLR